MIRSSKLSIKHANKMKNQNIDLFFNEYKSVVLKFIDFLWDKNEIPLLLPKEITNKIDTWFSKRMIQCAGKQASGIVRGTKQKQKQRLYIINKLTKEHKIKQAKKLQKIYNETNISKPKLNNVNPELDSRFIKIDLENKTIFDGWLTISSIGNKMKLIIPFNRSSHFNKWNKKGKLKQGVRISNRDITFMFDIPDRKKLDDGKILGIDIGQKTVISCSNGFTSQKNNHNHDLSTITNRLKRKKKGSKGFRREQEHRKNYINWTINQLKFKNIRQINIENIKNLRRGRRTNRSLSHWVYATIFDKLERKCEEQGVLVNHINPIYTSQRCSECGWTCKSNRNGKLFNCVSCGFSYDADLNASFNIALNLSEISRKKRLQQINRKGFYWLIEGQESIVPVVQKI